MWDDELKNSTSSTQGSNRANSSSHRKGRQQALGGNGGSGGNPLSDITNQVRLTSALESVSSRYVSCSSTEAKAVSGMASASTAVVPTGGGMTALTPPSTRSSKKKKSRSLNSTLTLTNMTTAAATC